MTLTTLAQGAAKAGSRRPARAAVLRPSLCRAACLALLPLLAACVSSAKEPEAPPVMRWDHRPEAMHWTKAAMNAVAEKDDVLAERVPADIATWCPGYAKASLEERRAFWVGVLSAVSKHESGWNPKAAGGGGRYMGLMQISPRTARDQGCEAQSAGALKDGSANLACAVEILADDVGRDGVVAGPGNRGVGRDWMPFRKADKRADMAAWTRVQEWCQAG